MSLYDHLEDVITTHRSVLDPSHLTVVLRNVRLIELMRDNVKLMVQAKPAKITLIIQIVCTMCA